jgi:hypothetical protein
MYDDLASTSFTRTSLTPDCICSTKHLTFRQSIYPAAAQIRRYVYQSCRRHLARALQDAPISGSQPSVVSEFLGAMGRALCGIHRGCQDRGGQVHKCPVPECESWLLVSKQTGGARTTTADWSAPEFEICQADRRKRRSCIC